jgi:hypothetical protein
LHFLLSPGARSGFDIGLGARTLARNARCLNFCPGSGLRRSKRLPLRPRTGNRCGG